MKLCVPRFGCLVQKALGTWNCVCLGLAALFKRAHEIKLCVPRFGCLVRKALGA